MPGEKDSWLQRNAGRLLRQEWRSPTELAQEFYSIIADVPAEGFSVSNPEVQERKPEAPKPPPAPESPTTCRGAPEVVPGRSTGQSPASGTTSLPGPYKPKHRIAHDESADKAEPDIATDPHTKPYKMDPPFPDWEWSLGVGGGGGGGTTTLTGKVVSGTGAQYQVQLYPSGSQNTPGVTVAVNIIQIDPRETIPPGTWITGIQQYTNTNSQSYYEAQIPIWLA